MGQSHTLLLSRQTFCYSSRMALKMTEEEWSQFAATALVCRSCFWSAEVTRPQNKIWCAHRVVHGWVTDKPRCDGLAFKYEDKDGDV